jgi:hypothetical protein
MDHRPTSRGVGALEGVARYRVNLRLAEVKSYV